MSILTTYYGMFGMFGNIFQLFIAVMLKVYQLDVFLYHTYCGSVYIKQVVVILLHDTVGWIPESRFLR